MFTDYVDLITNWTDTSNTSNKQEINMLLGIRAELFHGNLGMYQHIGKAKSSDFGHTLESFILSCKVKFVEGMMEKSLPCKDSFIRITK